MSANKKTMLAVVVLSVVAALMFGLWYVNRPKPQAGAKTIVVEVVHADASAKEFTYHTDAEYLGEVLLAQQLVEGENSVHGLFITAVDGETAQDSLRQWWCVTRGGEVVNTGVDDTPIADGDHFELTMSTY